MVGGSYRLPPTASLSSSFPRSRRHHRAGTARQALARAKQGGARAWVDLTELMRLAQEHGSATQLITGPNKYGCIPSHHDQLQLIESHHPGHVYHIYHSGTKSKAIGEQDSYGVQYTATITPRMEGHWLSSPEHLQLHLVKLSPQEF